MCDCWQARWGLRAWHRCHPLSVSAPHPQPSPLSLLGGSPAIFQDTSWERNYHVPTWNRATEILPWFIFLLAASLSVNLSEHTLLSRLLMHILFLLLVRPLGLALFLRINRFHMRDLLCWWKFLNCKILLVSGKRQRLESEGGREREKKKKNISIRTKVLVAEMDVVAESMCAWLLERAECRSSKQSGHSDARLLRHILIPSLDLMPLSSFFFETRYDLMCNKMLAI